MNAELDEQFNELDGILHATLAVDDHIDFESLKEGPRQPCWPVGPEDAPIPAPDPSSFLPPQPTGLGASLGLGRAKHEAAVREGQAAFQVAVGQHQEQERYRQDYLAKKRAWFEAEQRKAADAAAEQHRQVDAFRGAFERGEPQAVIDYFSLVLERSVYPEGFPQEFRAAYVPESKQLVVEYSLPSLSVVPRVKAYRYVKASDSFAETNRPDAQVKGTYVSVLAQLTLRTIHEVFEADRWGCVDVVVFNGVLSTVDPGTGKSITPCLVTVRTTRAAFQELNLGRVDPMACLKTLSASVSKSPAELAPVRPVLEFDMVDPRFVAESDALGALEQRPNLMALSPSEFEALIQNLFTKMGLEARQTRPSRDGGVDCVAYDPRPIFGGKVVIQAKRYKNTVGVSAVRDLFGTLQNEGASKGILVTTSGYGQSSFEFAQNKPIELIDGANLLYLLAEHAGVEARIVPPDEWTDPVADLGV